MNTEHDSSSGEDTYVYALKDKVPDLPKTEIVLNDNKLSVLIDSGASANCISEISYEKLKKN